MYSVKHPIIVIGIFIFVAVLFSISGCEGRNEIHSLPTEALKSLKDVSGLNDCQAYEGFLDDRFVIIVRCPNSSVSTLSNSGKQFYNTVTVENTNRAKEEWEASKKKFAERIKELEVAQKELDEALEKLKR